VFAVTVTALLGGTPGGRSEPATFTIGQVGCVGAPPPPSDLRGSVVNGTARVDWSPSPGATEYRVQVGAVQGGAEMFIGTVAGTTGIGAAGLPAGFAAWVRVSAVNACGTSAGVDLFLR
jgi:hypothetical protein